MTDIGRFKPEDKRGAEGLYRRVFGTDAADANKLRWDWQYRRNPAARRGEPLIWVAREGGSVIGQYAAMPVVVQINGREVDGAWGTDVMVAPERQRQGLGEQLFRTWDRNVGAALGLGLSESSHRLFQKLHWPDLGGVPSLVKPLSRRALRRATWSRTLNRLISAITLPWVRLVARPRPVTEEIRVIKTFDDRFDRLWARVAGKFAFAVRRDAAYLNWKYVQPPHVRYLVATLVRGDRCDGYIVYRHVREPLGRTTRLVDLLADPEDEAGVLAMLRWLDREARAADSDRIRTYVTHAGLRKLFKKSGYYQSKSPVQLVAKINALDVPQTFYASPDAWHIMLGDGDLDTV
ncbi:MAG: GNAT family N-acetyltransferase [Acidobacteriota bacterium]|nr:GNAT family N-acetyltransferase [Acidobacteriota bacterium]